MPTPRSRSRLPRWQWLVALVGLCGLGCSGSSGKLNPVQGKVLHQGQPLAGALVTFHPKGEADIKFVPPVGLTKEDGTFTVTTGKSEGAPAGEYVVTIICSELDPGAKKGGFSTAEPETRDRLRGAYANKANSRLSATITKGDNKLEPFDLK